MILIDFDRTLFDSDAFYNTIKKTLPTPLTNKQWDSLYSTYQQKYTRMNIFHMLKQAGLITNKEERTLVKSLTALARNHLYDDAENFIRLLKKENMEYTIFTYGDPAFQQFKLTTTQFNKYPSVVTPRPKSSHPLIKYATVIIDDNPVELEAMSYASAQRYRIKRPGAKYSNVEILDNKIHIGSNLHEIYSILIQKNV